MCVGVQLDFSSEFQRLSDRTESQGANSDDRLLIAGEVAQLLRVTTAWVYAETRSRRLPHVRLGRYVRYRACAINEWLAEQERASTARSRG
jgi:excisionase family DNA binding protein